MPLINQLVSRGCSYCGIHPLGSLESPLFVDEWGFKMREIGDEVHTEIFGVRQFVEPLVKTDGLMHYNLTPVDDVINFSQADTALRRYTRFSLLY